MCFCKTEEIHWCEWRAQMRTRWPHAVCPIKTHVWFLSKRQLAGWEGFSSFIKSGYGFLLSPTTSLAVRLASRGSSIQEASQCGWLILKALSCQEDLYSADGGNVLCQAFEIQMMSSTLCPTNGFESSHERKATEMGPTRTEGEQKGKINFIPKIDDRAKPKRRK